MDAVLTGLGSAVLRGPDTWGDGACRAWPAGVVKGELDDPDPGI